MRHLDKKSKNPSFSCTFIEKKEIFKNLFELHFEVKKELFSFHAGQYLQLSLPGKKSVLNSGLFSLSSSPKNRTRFSLAFHASKDPFHTALLALEKGQKVEAQGPLGVLRLPPASKSVVLLAEGLGILPFLSMIRLATEEKRTQKIQLLYLQEEFKELPYLIELQSLAQKNRHFKFQVLPEIQSKEWLEANIPFSSETQWLFKGSWVTTNKLHHLLLDQLGIVPTSIRFEEFFEPLPPIHLSRTPQKSPPLKELASSVLEALNTSAGVGITNLQGIITYANDQLVRISKYSRKELIGQNHRILKSGFNPPQLYKRMWKMISKGRVFRGEFKNKAKDGSFYWVDTSVAPIRNKKEEIIGYLSVHFPITEKKQLEMDLEKRILEKTQSLEQSKKAMLNIMEDLSIERDKISRAKAKDEAILENIGEGLVVMNLREEVTIINQAALKMMGLTQEEVVGQKWATLIKLMDEGGKKIDERRFPLKKALETGMAVFERRFYCGRKDGSRFPVSITASPIVMDEEQIGGIMVFQDITHEREVDQAKTEFVSFASHQLRTPLSTINWYTEMLLDGDAGKINKAQSDYLREIYASCQRMVKLVNDILNVSRLELGTFMIQPELIQITKIAEESLRELDSKLNEQKTKLIKKYDPNLPEIPLDLKLTHMIFLNLLSNAVKYSPEGSEVLLEIQKKKKHVLILVKDHGYGIPAHQQSKMFSKLFRADNVTTKPIEGTGFGLYIIKTIIEKSGGKIWFESVENQGTTFFVQLPLKGMHAKQGSKALT